ncbi:sulfite exporter TauE/SafE family protein [Ammoniphilus sp. YIM 78166]|uniref:sulfite exporter TauE/SafE family protein n=1 Tax=Ammoniphilus sp. YIM 78166 TaxID=1644106 RepID=UPI00106FC5EC|nr:sulfite exporter TauE/SafE family protein [Ammoniphilus sp. YIM 78166]
MPEFGVLEISMGLLASLLIGFSKTGISALGMFSIVLITQIIPAREASGLILPMLIAGDLIAVTYYRRNVVWKYILSLAPWVLGGIVIGYFVLASIDSPQLKTLLGILILSLLLIHVGKGFLDEKTSSSLPESIWFSSSMGILAGFATMVGNAAGSVMAIYLLAKGLPKNEFVGTGAWFFLLVNLIKVPFSVHLGLITIDTIAFNLWFLPTIVIGAIVGIKILPMIPQKHFQHIILVLTSIGAIRLIV